MQDAAGTGKLGARVDEYVRHAPAFTGTSGILDFDANVPVPGIMAPLATVSITTMSRSSANQLSTRFRPASFAR